MCSERPEIEQYHEGVVIPSMVGHTVLLLDKRFKMQDEGVMDWGDGRLATNRGRIPVPDGWYLVHHPEQCGND